MRIPVIIREIFHPRFVPWATKGVLAVTDQAFFAGTHFLLNVLLARWLTSAEYGVFALVYSVFVLFASLHSATFVEPMLVFGAGKYSDRLAEYLGILIRGHFLLLLPVSLFLAVVAVLIGRWSSSSVEHALLALAFTLPFILVLWMVRRAFYVELRPGWAMLGAVLYLIVLLVLLSAMRSISGLSTVTALAMMSVGAVVVSAFLLLRLRPQLI
jgi:O-antigen/teichoic acid export membrane protein